MRNKNLFIHLFVFHFDLVHHKRATMFLQFTFTLVFLQTALISGAAVLNFQEDPAVTRFRDYLRINSAHPTPDYDSCIAWLRNQAREIGLDFNLEYYEPEPEHTFAVWLTWNGTNPYLPSILMDSHMDVVIADPAKWNHHPYEAYKDAEGNIYARGAQDMKSTTIVTLEAIRRLKAEGFRPLRTVYILILPDEELYSRGVKAFANSTTFRNMNVGFTLDEGTTSEDENMLITYTEKVVWQYNITVYGTAMHGSLLPEVTSGQKLQSVINRLMEYRQTQVEILNDPSATVQNVTSLNLVKLGGGLGNNIIPDELWASFDMRIRIKQGWNLSDFDDMLNSIVAEAGNDTKITYLSRATESSETPVDDSNPWWVVLQRTCRQINTTCTPYIPTGVTDGRYIRNTGVPLFGLNTIPNTVRKYHEDNEYLNERSLLVGIDRMKIVIQNFASYLG